MLTLYTSPRIPHKYQIYQMHLKHGIKVPENPLGLEMLTVVAQTCMPALSKQMQEDLSQRAGLYNEQVYTMSRLIQ